MRNECVGVLLVVVHKSNAQGNGVVCKTFDMAANEVTRPASRKCTQNCNNEERFFHCFANNVLIVMQIYEQFSRAECFGEVLFIIY